MATGRLGNLDLAAATDTPLYVCPASTFTVLTVNMVNRAATPANIRIAVSTSASPGVSEFIEYDVELVGKGVIERTGIVLTFGQQVVVRSRAINVTAVAYGIETATA